ncbi:PepSY domain-containing protein [Pseudoalteromonas atlantica]|uniref:PepSY domain-containing protein n=1 Tax=Pseudoalteromonas atlantica TaxID=288 RepID=UPI003735C8DF
MRIVFLAFSIVSLSLLCFVYSNNSYAQDTIKKVAITKKQAVDIAKNLEDGKTLKITDQNDIYTVRILKSNGHVVDIHVNKKTGEVKKD